jgi:hypothetical protein
MFVPSFGNIIQYFMLKSHSIANVSFYYQFIYVAMLVTN